jgi:hypothetical protein
LSKSSSPTIRCAPKVNVLQRFHLRPSSRREKPLPDDGLLLPARGRTHRYFRIMQSNSSDGSTSTQASRARAAAGTLRMSGLASTTTVPGSSRRMLMQSGPTTCSRLRSVGSEFSGRVSAAALAGLSSLLHTPDLKLASLTASSGTKSRHRQTAIPLASRRISGSLHLQTASVLL